MLPPAMPKTMSIPASSSTRTMASAPRTSSSASIFLVGMLPPVAWSFPEL